MRFHISNYSGQYSIVSLALTETAKNDLLSEKVDFWYVDNDKVVYFPKNEVITDDLDIVTKLNGCNNYDVFVVHEDGNVNRCYDDSSIENVFFITGKCNSNCIMCPSPDYSRQHSDDCNIDELIVMAGHIPSDVEHITITGGEPFMAGKDIFKLLEYCKRKFVYTEFQILTNGRVFALNDYCQALNDTIPDNSLIGIPIHGSCADVHDFITQVKGSFNQTIIGLKRLQYLGISTEIRIVVCRNNVEDMENIAKLIVSELSKADHVCIMAMEMTGSAYINKDSVWVPYRESFDNVRKAVQQLITAGIDVRLYNFPLCTVSKDMWTLCSRSISSWKVRYAKDCDNCVVKESCGGVFSGTFELEKGELLPVL